MSRDLEVIVHHRNGCCWDTASRGLQAGPRLNYSDRLVARARKNK